jgi:hypothetical protein
MVQNKLSHIIIPVRDFDTYCEQKCVETKEAE